MEGGREQVRMVGNCYVSELMLASGRLRRKGAEREGALIN